jgi:hypothetical protein
VCRGAENSTDREHGLKPNAILLKAGRRRYRISRDLAVISEI